MKLPIQLFERDGHIWIQCTHPACRSRNEHNLSRMDAGNTIGNAEKLEEAIRHSSKEHGVP